MHIVQRTGRVHGWSNTDVHQVSRGRIRWRLGTLDHPCPIELVVFLLEFLDAIFVLPELDLAWSPPPTGLDVEEVTNNFRRKPPVGIISGSCQPYMRFG